MPAADAVLDSIAECCRLLARQPMMGRSRPELASDLRSFPAARHVIFYLPTADGIVIARVLHEARDVATIADQYGFEP